MIINLLVKVFEEIEYYSFVIYKHFKYLYITKL